MTSLIPILVGLFLLAALLRIDTYFSLVYLLAVAYLLGRAWSRQSARQLRTERRLVSRAFPGENIAVELRVRNDGWLPVPWVEMHDSLPVDMITPPYFRRVLSLLPHQERRFSYDLTAQKRGYYAIGPMVWHTGDLLGFSPQQVSEHKPETIYRVSSCRPSAEARASDSLALSLASGAGTAVRRPDAGHRRP